MSIPQPLTASLGLEHGIMITRDDIKRLLIWDALGAVAAGLIAAFFSRDFAYSLALGIAMVYMVEVFHFLNKSLLKSRIESLPRVRRVIAEIGASFASHLLGGILGALLATLLLHRYTPVALIYLVAFALFFPAAHSVQYVRMFYRELRETELQEERLKALAAEAELKALKAQINPHFLFNTLNTVAHLIRTDPPRAESTVEKLAEVFRYALFAMDKEVVPLGDELSFVKEYLALEQERFGDRLSVKTSVSPESLQVPVPPLILQPLVENAIRHGQSPNGEIELEVETRLQDESLLIAVMDRGPGWTTPELGGAKGGIGLHNVHERLQRKYGSSFGLELGDNQPHGAKVTMTIPREQR
jgi:signal transduction histidine kinase